MAKISWPLFLSKLSNITYIVITTLNLIESIRNKQQFKIWEKKEKIISIVETITILAEIF